MAHTSASLPTKQRILSTCVKLFLEQGYNKTTVAEIISGAEVSCSSFQNIFGAKNGILVELLGFMFQNQFSMAERIAGRKLPPPFVYGVETAIQMTMTEMNENLRDIYIEAYTHKETLDLIQHSMSKKLPYLFSRYLPKLRESDFYALDLGSSGLMRNYMARPCDEQFTLAKKLDAFLSASLRIYCVPEEEIRRVVDYVNDLDLCAIAQNVMEELFRSLAMHYNFSLKGILPEE